MLFSPLALALALALAFSVFLLCFSVSLAFSFFLSLARTLGRLVAVPLAAYLPLPL